MPRTVFERSKPAASDIAHALADARPGSFWLEDAGAAAPAFPALSGGVRADLVVVGGGFTGLWTALLAKHRRPDARVVLLEAKTIGWAASGRNGGFVEASLTHGDENGRSRFPREFATLQRLGLANLDAMQSTIAELGIDAEFERNGSIDLATEPHQVDWLREEADGVDRVFLDGEAVRREVHSPSYLAGLWHRRSSALVHPGKLVAGLARAAADAGVELFEHTPVTAVETRGLADGVEVRTPNGRIRAARVALATNVFPSLLARNRFMTVPVYDYVLMSEPLSAAQLAEVGWTHRQGLGDAANQFHYYRRTADDRILFGGYDAVYHYGGRVRPEYEERPESYERLASHFLTTFPQLAGIRFTHRWAGAIDTCTRFCAFYGLAREGRVAYAAGYTGLGLAATRFAAEVMLDRLAGLTTERTELELVRSRPLPFPPEPFASLGIQATRWSLDRADHRGGRRNLLLKTLDAAGLGFDS